MREEDLALCYPDGYFTRVSESKSFSEFTLLDPCCGSGHFLVAALNLLVPLRMTDEKLSARAACDAVLRENLHGLELDPRCTQIAAFALALAAWKYPEAGGYRELPLLNIACSGQGVAHAHLHVIPRRTGDGVRYQWPSKDPSPAELDRTAERIRAAF